jgi:hypothetical protein
MGIQALALLMIATGWLMIYFLEKKKGGISKEVFKVLCALSFTLNILGAFLCIVGLIGGF